MVESERKYLGRWDIAQAAEKEGAKHIYGPNDSTTPCQIRYQLASPVKCRLIWLKFSLKPSSQTVPDLFSFDERPNISHGGLPVLHAKRILVLGKQFLEESFSLDASMDRMSLKTMLDAPARMSRLRVSYIHPLTVCWFDIFARRERSSRNVNSSFACVLNIWGWHSFD